MDVDQSSALEVTIGPYEVYEVNQDCVHSTELFQDNLFGYKASFEAFVCIRDFVETEKLKKFGDYLQEIENNLPIQDKHKNPKVGADTPIIVVDEVLVAGDRGK